MTSQLALINSNGSSISTLNSNINNLSSSTNTNYNALLGTVNGHTTNLATLTTSVSNINSTLTSQLPTLATQTYVDSAVSNLVGAAPAALNTLYELASAISNNSSFSTTVLNSIGNVGITASTALNTVNSILNVLPTLATINYVEGYYQPLDSTGTLAAIPNNINTTSAYFPGFPNDQISWIGTGGATSTNTFSAASGYHQILTFPSSSILTFTSSNSLPSQTCTLTVSVMLGTATSLSLSITYGGTTYATNTYNGLSSTQYTNLSLSFTSPSGMTVSALNFNISSVGTIYTRGWAAFAGSSVITQIRGNLNIPYGSVSSSDFIYGGNNTSLAATIPNLQAALNTKLSITDPAFIGGLSNTGATFIIDSFGNMVAQGVSGKLFQCTDLKYAITGSSKFLTSTLSTLAEISGLSSIYANSFNALTNMTCASFRVNGNAEIIGDVLYGLGGTSLTNIVNSKAPILNPSFTGTVLSTLGDIKYNGATSLTTQMATLNGYKTSGTISVSSTYQTLYTVAQGTRGFITIVAIAPFYNMFMGYFEWTTSGSYQSLTRIAQSDNSVQANLNTTNASTAGTIYLSVQQASNTGPIQAMLPSIGTINWYVSLI